MELLEYLHIIKKRLWIILSVTILTTAVSAGLSIYAMSPIYEARSTLVIGRTPGNSTYQMNYSDVLMYQTLVKTYGEMIKSTVVAEEAILKSGYDIAPEQLQGSLSVSPLNDTQILVVAVQDMDPKRAAVLTNALCETFIEKVKTMIDAGEVNILDKAAIPLGPAKPNIRMNIAVAFFLGLMVSLGIIFLIEYLDNTIKTESDVEKYLALTVLAAIPYVKEGEGL